MGSFLGQYGKQSLGVTRGIRS